MTRKIIICVVAAWVGASGLLADVRLMHISTVRRTALDAGNYHIWMTNAYNQVPVMTGNASPTGTCSASSTLGGDYDAWAAFNHDNSTAVAYFSGPSSLPVWLQYQFATGAKVITRYAISTRFAEDVAGRNPRNFNLCGSTNGTDWVVLDERTDQFDATKTTKTRRYNVSNATAYEYYRLNITTNWGNAYVAVGEFELIGYEP